MNRRRSQSLLQGQANGFALVLALMLMAFVLLLLLSITTLVQVETRAATIGLEQLRARESARLALMLAIGELQQHIGPDQRVTARADILGEGNFAPEAKFWTGVWDTTDPSAAPAWLVSGENPTPNQAPAPSLQLVGAGSAGSDSTQHVYAPQIEVLDRSGNVAEALAWWISDEGVKASVGTLPLNQRTSPNVATNHSIPALDTMLSSVHGLEDLFTDYDRFRSNDATTLNRISSLEQLFAQADFQDPSTWRLASENQFHCVTPLSLGVLASVLPAPNGGLMQDLSLFPKLINSEFETIIERAAITAATTSTAATDLGALRQFVNLRGLDDLGPLTDGKLAEPITPILSNFMMGFTIRSESPVSSHPNFYLRMRFFCEFWNPYTSGLRMTDTNGNHLDLELEITGLPTVIVEKTTGTRSSSPPIDLQDRLKDPANPDGAVIIRLRYDQQHDWLPGQTKNWTGIDATTTNSSSPYVSLLTESKAWNDASHNLGGSTGIDTGIPRLSGSIRHTSTGSNTLSVKVYAINHAIHYRSLLTELNGIEYQAVSTRPTGYASTHSGATFGYHFILRGPHFSAADPEYYRGLWLREHDPRNPRPSFNSEWYLDNDPSKHMGSAYAPVKDGISPLLLPDPSEINETNNTINTVIFRRLWDRSNSNVFPVTDGKFNKLWQDAPLFELPRERPLALASLQHLYFHNERPNKVGNSWGDQGEINTLSWFDRYYFSGLSRTDTSSHYASNLELPNPILATLQLDNPHAQITRWQTAESSDSNQARELAQRSLVVNRFNLNSTSVAAWKAVLGGLRINQWHYLDYPEDTSDLSALTLKQETRARMFARFSHSLAETYEAPQTPAFEGIEPVAPSAYYRRGARHFDADEIEQLAQEIVARLKAQALPFLSMEAFLAEQSAGNGSLMEQAIATVFAPNGRQQWDHRWETEGIRGDASEIIDIDHFSPGFLTQADVMTAIGPMLAPRSDSFKIRASAQSYAPEGTVVGSATIEATFQRIPATVVPNTPMNEPAERQLKLTSLRWLTEHER
jgi:hypothetical protein